MNLFSWSIYLIWDKASLNRRTQPLGTNWESISLPRGPFTSVVAANQAWTQQLIHTGGLHDTAYYICGKDKDGQALDCLKEIIEYIYHSQTLKRPRNLKKSYNYIYMQMIPNPVSHRFFPQRWADRATYISPKVKSTNCRLYYNIS